MSKHNFKFTLYQQELTKYSNKGRIFADYLHTHGSTLQECMDNAKVVYVDESGQLAGSIYVSDLSNLLDQEYSQVIREHWESLQPEVGLSIKELKQLKALLEQYGETIGLHNLSVLKHVQSVINEINSELEQV